MSTCADCSPDEAENNAVPPLLSVAFKSKSHSLAYLRNNAAIFTYPFIQTIMNPFSPFLICVLMLKVLFFEYFFSVSSSVFSPP
eukprot:09474.XXX_604577_604828_1 [CDS] Oithona nana genome sequencing.